MSPSGKGNQKSVDKLDVLKIDAQGACLNLLIKKMKTLLHNLNRVVKTGEDIHKVLYE
jgi:hypothetical protein